MSKEELDKEIIGNSFIISSNPNDSMEVEFEKEKIKSYSWNYFIYENWEIIKQNDSLVFHLSGNDFLFKKKEKNILIFEDIKNGKEIHLNKITSNKINKNELIGNWIAEEDLCYLDTINPPPPAPCNLIEDYFQIPHVEINNNQIIILTPCDLSENRYSINEKFGVITITDKNEEWKIKKIINDTIILDKKYKEKNSIKYKENIKLIKYGG